MTGRYGTLGRVYFVRENFWPLNTTLYVRDFRGNDPRFISYFLQGVDFSAYSDKAAVPGLNRNHLHREVVRLPSTLGEQRAIAHILGTLDDKIELNRRMNETLEAMARALFKSWFVDFDPVRAKMEGRDTALPQDIADLFPDRLVDSEMGEIPEWWEKASLGAVRRRKNVVQARSFAELLAQTVRRYATRAVEAAQVIEELLQLARDMREANARGEALGLSDDELAFYDALKTNDSAVQVLGDETLRDIARELVETVRNNVRIGWALRENVRANLRRLVKRVLRKHGYPPDKQEQATRTVLEQAEVVSAGWTV